MEYVDIIAREADFLPSEKQAEVLDFIAFLKMRQSRTEEFRLPKRLWRLRHFSAASMWTRAVTNSTGKMPMLAGCALEKKLNTQGVTMTDSTNTKRIPLAADTDPTDEELSEVMREALDLAMSRKQESDNWMRHKLAEAVKDARGRDVAPAS
jgi:hypothetical protein